MFRLFLIPLVVGMCVYQFNRVEDFYMCSPDPQLNNAQMIYEYVEPTQIVSTNWNLIPFTQHQLYVGWEQSQPTAHPFVVFQQTRQDMLDDYVKRITTLYKIEESFAREIVELAYENRRTDFPQTKDIIAIVGIESSFNPHAQSSLAIDPAIGLMQIRSKVWRISRKDLLDVKKNVFHGAEILEQYYTELGKRRYSAVQAYNIGITAYRKGRTNPNYLRKYTKEVAVYNVH